MQWNGRRKRSLPVPATTGLVPGSAAEDQEQLFQTNFLAGKRKRVPPVPGTTGLVKRKRKQRKKKDNGISVPVSRQRKKKQNDKSVQDSHQRERKENEKSIPVPRHRGKKDNGISVSGSRLFEESNIEPYDYIVSSKRD